MEGGSVTSDHRAKMRIAGRSMHLYEVRPRKERRGVDLISNALLFERLWYTKPDDAVEYAKFFSRSPDL